MGRRQATSGVRTGCASNKVQITVGGTTTWPSLFQPLSIASIARPPAMPTRLCRYHSSSGLSNTDSTTRTPWLPSSRTLLTWARSFTFYRTRDEPRQKVAPRFRPRWDDDPTCTRVFVAVRSLSRQLPPSGRQSRRFADNARMLWTASRRLHGFDVFETSSTRKILGLQRSPLLIWVLLRQYVIVFTPPHVF